MSRSVRRVPKKVSASRGVRRLTSTDVQRNFADVLNRVRYRGETVIVERGGETVCEIHPSSTLSTFTGDDFVALLQTLPRPGDEWADAVEAVIRKQPKAEAPKWPL